MKSHTICSFFFLLLISTFLEINLFAQSADIVLTNGKIFTSDTTHLYAQAVAIKGNRILAVGSNDEIERLISSKTQRINLKGKTVVSGFNEAHEHLGHNEFGHVGQSISLSTDDSGLFVEGPDKKVVLDSISSLLKRTKPGQWITAPIGMKMFLDPSVRESLDAIAPDNPVYLGLPWGHGGVPNGKALQLAGIPESAPDFLGAYYIRNPRTNKITSIYDYAQWPIWKSFFMSEPENFIRGLKDYSLEQIKHGITSVQDMNNNVSASNINIFAKAKLSQRIRIIPYVATSLKGRSVEEWKRLRHKISPLVYTSGIKYQIDGTPLEQMALMKKPYPGTNNWHGRLDIPVDTIKNILREALADNRQLMMHIVGDSTLSIVISLMKQMAPADVWRQKRVRFEHNEVRNIPEEIKAIKDMGILIMHTPMYNRERLLQSLLKKGITVGIAADGTINPFDQIVIMCSQQADPNENISREQAVIAYTSTNAFAEFAEYEKGKLKKGMLADLAVLSQDIFTVPNEQLTATRSILTITDGKIVYHEPESINVLNQK